VSDATHSVGDASSRQTDAASNPETPGRTPATCPECGTGWSPHTLSCPGCRRLVHGARLKQLARAAESALSSGDPRRELGLRREIVQLLPRGSRQHAAALARAQELSKTVSDGAPPSAAAKGKVPKWLAGLGGLGLLLWKFKWAAVFVATKGKFLLLGLTKWQTFFSMALAMGVYWTIWGWPFAVGLVLAIYVHEMGHVAALRHYGIAATAPMFIPGVGAFVRLKQAPLTPVEDARIGLAGPLWGLGAVFASYGLFLVTGEPIFAAIARAGAWLNLFNLLPVWQLDGARAFAALTRKQRGIAAIGLIALWFLTGDFLLLIIGGIAAFRAWRSDAPSATDTRGLVAFLVVAAALAAMAAIDVPGLETVLPN
jgi:Zn-dependent protease